MSEWAEVFREAGAEELVENLRRRDLEPEAAEALEQELALRLAAETPAVLRSAPIQPVVITGVDMGSTAFSCSP